MPFTRYTERDGSIRLVIDRASVPIYVTCMLLGLILVFAVGYLGGLATRPSVERTPLSSTASSPSDEAPIPPENTLIPEDTVAVLRREMPRRPIVETREETPSPEIPEEEDATRIQGEFSNEETPPTLEDQQTELDVQPPGFNRDSVGRRGGYVVQVGVFRFKETADSLVQRLQILGYNPEQVYTRDQVGIPGYRITIGSYNDLESAEAAAARYRTREGGGAFAVRRIIRDSNN